MRFSVRLLRLPFGIGPPFAFATLSRPAARPFVDPLAGSGRTDHPTRPKFGMRSSSAARPLDCAIRPPHSLSIARLRDSPFSACSVAPLRAFHPLRAQPPHTRRPAKRDPQAAQQDRGPRHRSDPSGPGPIRPRPNRYGPRHTALPRIRGARCRPVACFGSRKHTLQFAKLGIINFLCKFRPFFRGRKRTKKERARPARHDPFRLFSHAADAGRTGTAARRSPTVGENG